MKAFVAIASLIAAASAQLVAVNNVGAYGLAAPYAAAVAPAAVAPVAAVPAVANSQFHAQDELGQFQFGYANPLGARQEARDAYGVTRGSFTQVDANGQLQVRNYIASPLTGFQVEASDIPLAPIAPVVAPLEAPVFKAAPLEAPVMTLEQVDDTEEVKAAKAEFFAKFDEAKNREKRQAILPAGVTALNAFGYNALPAFGYNAIPALAAPAIAAPAIAAPAIAPVAATYNTAGAPSAAAIPSEKLTIKLNPGHSTFYRVDPVA